MNFNQRLTRADWIVYIERGLAKADQTLRINPAQRVFVRVHKQARGEAPADVSLAGVLRGDAYSRSLKGVMGRLGSILELMVPRFDGNKDNVDTYIEWVGTLNMAGCPDSALVQLSERWDDVTRQGYLQSLMKSDNLSLHHLLTLPETDRKALSRHLTKIASNALHNGAPQCWPDMYKLVIALPVDGLAWARNVFLDNNGGLSKQFRTQLSRVQNESPANQEMVIDLLSELVTRMPTHGSRTMVGQALPLLRHVKCASRLIALQEERELNVTVAGRRITLQEERELNVNVAGTASGEGIQEQEITTIKPRSSI